jgi:hypothetical protein
VQVQHVAAFAAHIELGMPALDITTIASIAELDLQRQTLFGGLFLLSI